MVRYGYHGGGEGRQGRWDVAMLERNGLRHGGFELREDKGDWEDGTVRGLGWNSDSEILAVWIERKERDVCKWRAPKTGNYTDSTSATMVHEKLPLLSQAGTLLSRYAKTQVQRVQMAPGRPPISLHHLPR